MPSRMEILLNALVNGTPSSELPPAQSRNEALLIELLDKINQIPGGGATLNDLKGVSVQDVKDGQVLSYDGVSDAWVGDDLPTSSVDEAKRYLDIN